VLLVVHTASQAVTRVTGLRVAARATASQAVVVAGSMAVEAVASTVVAAVDTAKN
jgi:hypothetical protein